MYIFLLMGLVALWYIWHNKKEKLTEFMGYQYKLDKQVESERRFEWFIPYYKSQDKGEKLIGLVQVVVVFTISCMSVQNISSFMEGWIIFCVTFIVYTWLIKIMVNTLNWLQMYSKMLTLNGAFAIFVPIIILWHMPKMCNTLEIRLTLLALLLSTYMVYGEIIHIVTEKGVKYTKSIQIKGILTWLGIILMNLYTLLVYVQFYMNVKAHHFITAEHLNKEAMIDLFYYLIITFTTVGFGDIRPSTGIAKIITCMVAVSGMLFTGMFMGAVLSHNEKY